MKVGDIIRGTEWHPGPSYGRDQPLLSVLLPTFRRGKSGLFLKAGRSVLQQKLQELELIIVDDASTDGTADQIAQLMREDPRVSCLRHPQNVGLPAISEYEAFRRARAEHIAFAFDDDEFYPEALGGLLRQATELGKAFVHGYVELHASDGHGGVQKLQDFGRDKTPQSLLRSNNYISNNSVLLHRRVFETVGMYDPHVCMARLCDWDLFRRVAERYDVTRVDVAVGRVLGPSTSDSLGHTYVHESWLSAEWMNTPRDALLLPSTIEDYDVLAAPSSLSRSARLEIEELRPQFRSKFWFPAEAASGRDEPADGHILVVCASLDVSVTLYFDQLPQHYKQRVRIIHYSTWHSGLPEEMVGASAVVFVRALFNFAHWIEQARRLGIPHYYFLDDNLMLLAQEPKYAADYGSYTDDNVREMLSSFSGVLLSTAPLVEYFEQKRLHGRLLLYPPVASRPEDHERGEPAPRDPGVLRVGFFGGGHRAEAFLAEVLPALRALGRRRRVELVTIGLAQGSVLAPELRVVQLEYEHTYDLALRRMMAHGLDVLVHPNSATVNNRYKTQHVLINAHLLGAAPVMSREPPYDALPAGEFALCDHDPAAWETALERLAASAEERERGVAAAGRFCEAHYSGRANTEALDAILSEHPPAGLLLRDVRYRRAMGSSKSTVAASAQLRPVPVAGSMSYRVPAPPGGVSEVFTMIGSMGGALSGDVRLEVKDARTGALLGEASVSVSNLNDWSYFSFRFEKLPAETGELILRFVPATDRTMALFETSDDCRSLQRRLLRKVSLDRWGKDLSHRLR